MKKLFFVLASLLAMFGIVLFLAGKTSKKSTEAFDGSPKNTGSKHRKAA